MKLGYARVSTGDQNLDGQCQRLSAAGCEKLFEEKISGVMRNRPRLEKLIEQLRKGDVLVVTRLDRLARSTSDLLRIAENLTEKSAGLQSLDEPWADTTSPSGRMVMTIFAGIADGGVHLTGDDIEPRDHGLRPMALVLVFPPLVDSNARRPGIPI